MTTLVTELSQTLDAPSASDALAGAGWELIGLPAGAVDHPSGLPETHEGWIRAEVPGTVASALCAAGRPVERDALDGLDWWYRCRFSANGGAHRLEVGGIATLGDVWIDGEHLLSSSNMHRPRCVVVADLTGSCELVARCAALAPRLARRGPRPRWKTYLVEHQGLRSVRTSLLGRVPGWASVPAAVGLWRPMQLRPVARCAPTEVAVRATCEETTAGGPWNGTVQASFLLPGRATADGPACLLVGGASAPLEVRPATGGVTCSGVITVPDVDLWWPHTHGPQPRYEVHVQVCGEVHLLGAVGFRSISADRSDGGFRLVLNGQPIFCRGATWFPPDPVSLSAGEEAENHLLGLAREAGFNMVRVPGTTVYEGRRFFDRCDELGILVWHDCMFAFTDPPDDEAFGAEVEAELRSTIGALGGHPSLAVVCGNQEVDEVAAMFGLDPERRSTPLFERIGEMVEALLPGVPYVSSNPCGGDPPFRMNTGISQYFGVGGYLRPLDDARRAGVRFASECLALATPPEPRTVEERCGGAWRAGHDPEWKLGVHHDAGRSWDMEDVRDHYVAALFGCDPRKERYVDAERALELGRATNALLMESVFSEWRRPGSSCEGGLVLGLADLRAGAGWGLVDSEGRPKAPWYALRRVLSPVALLCVDEGLNGLALHVVNDTGDPLDALLAVELVAHGETVVERAEVPVHVDPRATWSSDAETVLGAWRDVTYAYRFAPPQHDAVVATLRSVRAESQFVPEEPAAPGRVLSQIVHLPLGQARALEADLGLTATARRHDGRWTLDVRTTRLAQWVAIRPDGFVPADSWFHLPPGGRRVVELWPEPGKGKSRQRCGREAEELGDAPHGTVQALNALAAVPIRQEAR